MWAPDEPCGEPGYDGVLALEDHFVSHGTPTVIFRPVLFMDNLQTLFAKPALGSEGVYRHCHRPGLLGRWVRLADVPKYQVSAYHPPGINQKSVLEGKREQESITYRGRPMLQKKNNKKRNNQ